MTGAPGRPGPARRLRLRAGYAWTQSADPWLAATHAWLDTRLRSMVSVTSTAGPDAVSIGYLGVSHGIVKIHQLLERQRDALGATVGACRQTLVVPTRLGSRRLRPDTDVPDTDLVAVGCAPGQADRMPSRAALLLPYRLHLVTDVPQGDDEWRRRVSRRERQWFAARQRADDPGLEFSSDEASFHFFYDRMHLPTMRLRHGERARSEARDTALECLFRTGLLAFVTVGGVRVSGSLCHWNRRTSVLTIRLVGVLDGARAHYDDGALRLADHLLLDWASRNGVRHVDFGGTEAWLSQGTFRWKRKFWPRVTLAPNHLGRLRVWWHARRDTPAVRDFLVANPVLELVDGHHLRAVYFHDDARPARFDLAHRCANVTDCRTVHLDRFLAGVPDRTIEGSVG